MLAEEDKRKTTHFMSNPWQIFILKKCSSLSTTPVLIAIGFGSSHLLISQLVRRKEEEDGNKKTWAEAVDALRCRIADVM